MPQERENPYPFPTAEEIEAAPGSREQKSARFVICRYVTGIPSRDGLLGNNDQAPIYRGVADLTVAAWAVLDAMDANPNVTDAEHQAREDLREILTQHGRAPAERELDD